MKGLAPETEESDFTRKVKEKEQTKLKAVNEKKESPLYGFGMFGMVGWSVAVPTLLGAALGISLDRAYPGSISWTLTCIVSGLVGGCFIAWKWVLQDE